MKVATPNLDNFLLFEQVYKTRFSKPLSTQLLVQRSAPRVHFSVACFGDWELCGQATRQARGAEDRRVAHQQITQYPSELPQKS